MFSACVYREQQRASRALGLVYKPDGWTGLVFCVWRWRRGFLASSSEPVGCWSVSGREQKGCGLRPSWLQSLILYLACVHLITLVCDPVWGPVLLSYYYFESTLHCMLSTDPLPTCSQNLFAFSSTPDWLKATRYGICTLHMYVHYSTYTCTIYHTHSTCSNQSADLCAGPHLCIHVEKPYIVFSSCSIC